MINKTFIALQQKILYVSRFIHLWFHCLLSLHAVKSVVIFVVDYSQVDIATLEKNYLSSSLLADGIIA